ncbi:hypothetical protein N7495_005038 [Penicillium taxi]|uniref:uncharacterized protein n=1 Tax=Penicillium taxi TaxID=168475 RepID=UPI002545A82E|nr:uncharacterized protein N7495_005038 [Penicillium taxi]KAJ5893347.1 hypothetical protein N7495_005038 [Penicillium taxi]
MNRDSSSSATSFSTIPSPLSVATNPGLHTYESKVWEGIEIGTARSPNLSWFGASSLFYFIGRMNRYLSATLQQTQSTDQMALHGSAITLLGAGASETTVDIDHQAAISANNSLTAGKFLSPTQEEYFLDLFWSSYHTCLFPIINEAEFMAHYRSLWKVPGEIRRPSALVDIVIAICMQFGVSKLPTDSQQPIADGDACVSGRWYYQRCQMLVGYQLENPTISTVQTLMLCSIYLCNGSFQNMSASASATATRAAYAAGLHIKPSITIPVTESELRKRIWWALYSLDSKIGMKLGRPFLVERSAAEPGLPEDDPDAALRSGSHFAPLTGNRTWLSFHHHNAKLFIVAREIHTNFYAKEINLSQGQSIWDDPEALESHAELLQFLTKSLEKWVDEVPSSLKTSRQNHGSPFSTDGSRLNIEQFTPIWVQRQRLNLELMYHNLCLNLHRPFISFYPGSATGLAEQLAVRCARHAITLTNITHQALSSTSILAGWHEAFQLQWNASMTIVGFVIAYPQGAAAGEARKAIDAAISVFDMFGQCFSVATTAATILRNLSCKIEFLLQHYPEAPSKMDSGLMGPVGNDWLDNLMADAPSFPNGSDSSMQDMIQMAFGIDGWRNLDALMPTMGDDIWGI